MALPLARTSAEAHLYMELHPCACGETSFGRQSAVVEAEGDLASYYSGPCARCGTAREFLFRLPAEILPVVAGEVRFGDERPSELLDRAKAPPRRRLRRHVRAARAAADLATAAAAMDEVLKFVPPGADEVPETAFWSDQGAAVYAAEPGRFRAARLEAVRDTYRQLLAQAAG